jgi:DNA-binding XRE family transcriptional regulator
MSTQTLHLDGKAYVVVPQDQYEQMAILAKIPQLPELDAKGNYPAIEYARATLARSIIQDRLKAGLTQRELAELAGIRAETLCRIETGKHTASVPTIEKIDRVLNRRLKKAKRKRKEK